MLRFTKFRDNSLCSSEFWHIQPCWLTNSYRRFGRTNALKMEAKNYSRMSVDIYQLTRRRILENLNVHQHLGAPPDLKSCDSWCHALNYMIYTASEWTTCVNEYLGNVKWRRSVLGRPMSQAFVFRIWGTLSHVHSHTHLKQEIKQIYFSWTTCIWF